MPAERVDDEGDDATLVGLVLVSLLLFISIFMSTISLGFEYCNCSLEPASKNSSLTRVSTNSCRFSFIGSLGLHGRSTMLNLFSFISVGFSALLLNSDNSSTENIGNTSV